MIVKVNTDIVKQLGMPAAIVFAYVDEKSSGGVLIYGYSYSRIPIEKMVKELDCMSKNTVISSLAKLERADLVQSLKVEGDRVKWYCTRKEGNVLWKSTDK